MDLTVTTAAVWGASLAILLIITKCCIPWLKPRRGALVWRDNISNVYSRLIATLHHLQQPEVFQHCLLDCKKSSWGSIFYQPEDFEKELPCFIVELANYPHYSQLRLHVRFELSSVHMADIVPRLKAEGYTAWLSSNASLECLLCS